MVLLLCQCTTENDSAWFILAREHHKPLYADYSVTIEEQSLMIADNLMQDLDFRSPTQQYSPESTAGNAILTIIL